MTAQNFIYMLPAAWLAYPLKTMHYVMYFWFCGWRHIFT